MYVWNRSSGSGKIITDHHEIKTYAFPTKAIENINLFSVYFDISYSPSHPWILSIDIPTHSSETKELKMTA